MRVGGVILELTESGGVKHFSAKPDGMGKSTWHRVVRLLDDETLKGLARELARRLRFVKRQIVGRRQSRRRPKQSQWN